MAEKYRVVGGGIVEAYDTLRLLEQHCPTKYLQEAEVVLSDSSFVHVCQHPQKPQLHLPLTEKTWGYHLENCKQDYLVRKIAGENMITGYEVSLGFHIAITVAHEWCHLLQAGVRYGIDQRGWWNWAEPAEQRAEEWAWKFVLEYYPGFVRAELFSSQHRSKQHQIDCCQLELDYS